MFMAFIRRVCCDRGSLYIEHLESRQNCLGSGKKIGIPGPGNRTLVTRNNKTNLNLKQLLTWIRWSWFHSWICPITRLFLEFSAIRWHVTLILKIVYVLLRI